MRYLAAAVLVFGSSLCVSAGEARKPNIVFILADDACDACDQSMTV